MALHETEWLHLAKQLPVGGVGRHYHGAERRPNLVVKNLQDRYTCWCHSCHSGGVVQKEHVRLTDAPEVVPSTKDVGFLRGIDTSRPDPNVPFKEIVTYLHSKNMTLEYLKQFNPQWSANQQRLVLSSPDQVLGRDITGRSKSKWFRYSGERSYVRGTAEPFRPTVILVEDLFSAAKGQYFCPPSVLMVAMTGTVLYDDLLVELLKVGRVYLMLDADKAGAEGMLKAKNTLKLFGKDVHDVSLPEGLDPKDMPPSWWVEFMRSITNVMGNL